MDPDRLIADNLDLPRMVAYSVGRDRLWSDAMDELVADANEALVRAARRYVPYRERLFRPWAYTTMRRDVIDQLRSRTHWRARHKVEIVLVESVPDAYCQPDVYRQPDTGRLVDVDDAIGRLDLSEGTAIMLRLLARGWSKQQIARRYGVTEGAISHRLTLLRNRGEDVRLRRMIEV